MLFCLYCCIGLRRVILYIGSLIPLGFNRLYKHKEEDKNEES